MAAITAQAVNEFRKATGLGLMECKTLLKEADGDTKKAMTLAKERGLSKAQGRAGRAATAGRVEVAIAEDGRSGAMVEVNCETDFVARNDAFRQLAKSLAQHVLATGTATGDILDQSFTPDPARTVREVVLDVNSRTGENITVGRSARFAVGEGPAASLPAGLVDSYIHHDGKSGALIEVDCETAATAQSDDLRQLARDLALQVVASRPLCVRREEMPKDVVEEQRRIFVTQASDKPEAVRDKIAEGKLNAWYSESVLLDQPSVKDPARKVRDLIQDLGKQVGETIAVVQFARLAVGEAPPETAPAS